MTDFSHFSKIIAETMTWGAWGKQLPKKEMIALMHECLALEISTFDHADIYGNYTTEADFGKALKESKIARNQIQLISKCGIQLQSEARKTHTNHYDYSKEHIIASVERSLKNLNTDYLDLLLLHRPSPLMDPEVIPRAIGQLKDEGKIIQIGVSNFTPSQMAMVETQIQMSAHQVEFSLTTNSVMYDGTLDDCVAHRRYAMSWSPLGKFFKENSKQTQRIQRVLEPLMEKYNASADQLLLAWIMEHPSKIHPVVGTTTKKRLSNSQKATQINMELQDWFALLEASHGHPVP